jgi:hypothetical protein
MSVRILYPNRNYSTLSNRTPLSYAFYQTGSTHATPNQHGTTALARVRSAIKTHAPCRDEVGEDEEHVAAAADDERALGPYPRDHGRRGHGEEREGGVEDPHRDGAQVALLHRGPHR